MENIKYLSYRFIGVFKKYTKEDKKILGIMEPNLNIVKFSLIPTMVAEECYRGEIGKNHIDKLRITNSEKVSYFPSHILMMPSKIDRLSRA